MNGGGPSTVSNFGGMNSVEQSLRHRTERRDRLTQIDPASAMGRYLRYFWWPVAHASTFEEWPVKKIRVLGEDLALYRLDDGTVGLLADRCPHRGASLSCGMTDGAHLRCAYHGWAFGKDGRCTETPAEPATSTLRHRINIAGYPVQEMGSLLWAYLGPQPAPLLPRFEGIVREDRERSCGYTELPCSWLACADNSMDPIHLEHLHLRYTNWVRAQRGQPPIPAHRHVKIDFEPFPFGIMKKRLWEGQSEDSDEWRVGHPLIFPSTLMVPIGPGWSQFQFRVPVDTDRTMIFWYDSREPQAGADTSVVPFAHNPYAGDDGNFRLDAVNAQDMMMWITQGPAPDHADEHLGETDRGIALFRRITHEQLDRVERGEEPLGVLRDPQRNTPYLSLPIENQIGYSLAGVPSGARYEFPEYSSTGSAT
jgi:5,5'-dehydrodivanillate O-demethylase